MKKYIKYVTVTGASDETSFEDMIAIQKMFPYVEWGILYSPSYSGKSKRYPSQQWLFDLLMLLESFNNAGKPCPLNISFHLCGEAVRTVLTDYVEWITDKGTALNRDKFVVLNAILSVPTINRIQINTHGKRYDESIGPLVSYMNYLENTQIIGQYDGVNFFVDNLRMYGYSNVAYLYDLSNGSGVLPDEWHKPIPGIFTGYAGGLSPENLEEQLQKLDKIVDVPVWIDAESWLRTNDYFDLNKVIEFLTVAKSRVIEP